MVDVGLLCMKFRYVPAAHSACGDAIDDDAVRINFPDVVANTPFIAKSVVVAAPCSKSHSVLEVAA